MSPAASGGQGTSSGEPAVRLVGVRKRFGYREVLRGVDLEVPRGTCLALFGPNGAGKSTLLRIVSTLSRPTAGRVEVLGLDARSRSQAVRERLGVVFHQSFLRPELTLEENLRFYLALHGQGGERAALERAGELLDRLGIGAFRHQPVRTFSQGMLKRANIARSLLHAPHLWLLDEPFSGLDPQGRELLSVLLRHHLDEGGTTVLVTHQTELGRELATRAVSIAGGVIVPGAAAA